MEQIEKSIRIGNLINSYLTQEISWEEESELMSWVKASKENETLFKSLTDERHLKQELDFFESISVKKAFRKTTLSLDGFTPVRSIWARYRNGWMSAAAILLLLTGAWLIRLLNSPADKEQKVVKTVVTPAAIVPGGNKAYLILADGRSILLDSSADGQLAKQGNVSIRKENGKLAYNSGAQEGEVLYNTIRTPKGGQYQLELSDGSKVWLNAASTLRFPASFTGKERRVEMTGEAYFEIAKKNGQPFIVSSNGIDTRVTGTHFNINAYPDELFTSTTLLEGAVAVQDGMKKLLLLPGEQARYIPGQPLMLVKHPDLDEVMAWKKGKFIFNEADIKTIMRQISRWYDVDIIYEGTVRSETFSGMVSRESNISKVLRIMEEGGVKFSIESRKIIVK